MTSFDSACATTAIETQAFSQAAFEEPFPRKHHREEQMHRSPSTNPRFINRGEQSANWHHISTTPECNDWLADQLRAHSAKEIANKSGQGQRAAESVKQGRNGMTMAHLVSMCRADPEFRASFFRFCGGHLEGEPEMVAALSHAINAVLRKNGGRNGEA